MPCFSKGLVAASLLIMASLVHAGKGDLDLWFNGEPVAQGATVELAGSGMIGLSSTVAAPYTDENGLYIELVGTAGQAILSNEGAVEYPACDPDSFLSWVYEAPEDNKCWFDNANGAVQTGLQFEVPITAVMSGSVNCILYYFDPIDWTKIVIDEFNLSIVPEPAAGVFLTVDGEDVDATNVYVGTCRTIGIGVAGEITHPSYVLNLKYQGGLGMLKGNATEYVAPVGAANPQSWAYSTDYRTCWFNIEGLSRSGPMYDLGYQADRIGAVVVELSRYENGVMTVVDSVVFNQYDLPANPSTDMDDLTVLAQEWLATGCTAGNGWCAGADFTEDGKVDLQDYTWLESNWLLYTMPTYKYVDAINGSEAGDGSEENPWKRIQQACAWIKAHGAPFGGLVVRIKAGVYRESVRLVVPNWSEDCWVRLEGYGPGVKQIRGDDIIGGPWAAVGNSIYCAGTGIEVEQLFVNDVMMLEAREPDTNVADIMTPNLYYTDAGSNAATLVDSQLPAGDWNGAYVWIAAGAAWSGFSKQITDYIPGDRLGFANTEWLFEPLTPEKGDWYFLYGSLAGLDYPGEWFKPKSNIVYLRCLDSGSPADDIVSAKQRTYGLNVMSQGYVTVKGLSFFACGVNLNNAYHCRVEDCDFRYADFRRHTYGAPDASLYSTSDTVGGIYMAGSNNSFSSCIVEYGSNYGICEAGSYNVIEDCVLAHIGWHGMGGDAAISCSSENAEYQHNRVYSTGRIGVRVSGNQFDIHHNEVSDAMLLGSDGGCLYMWNNDSMGGKIHHNHFHSLSGHGVAGVYLDSAAPAEWSGSRNTYIYRNLFWNITDPTGWWASGVMLNTPSPGNWVCNNTAINCDSGFFAGASGGGDILGTKVYNNIFNATEENNFGVGGDIQTSGFYDVVSSNPASSWFGWGSGMPPMDSGIFIDSEITPYAPIDIGCYDDQGPASFNVGPR